MMDLTQQIFTGEDSSNTYSREANPGLYSQSNHWTSEMQASLDDGSIKPHPVREVVGVDSKWDAIAAGLDMLQTGEVRGQKLTIRIAAL